MKEFKYKVDQRSLSISVEGDTFYGDDMVLLDSETNIIEHSTFSELGFTVVNFLDEKTLLQLRSKLIAYVSDIVEPIIGKRYDINTIQSYHKDVTELQHKKIISTIYNSSGRGVDISSIDFDFSIIEKRISEICNRSNLSCKMPINDNKEFYIRLVRPTNGLDANPPHRDVWIPRLKNAVNIHFIVAGNQEDSTLAVLPCSHLWSESDIERTVEGAIINGTNYQVPSVVNTKKSMNLIRPRMLDNDVLVFSPYLIHGGGPNTSNVTRVSLEMRFW